MRKTQITYEPIKFIAITFILSWACAFFGAYQPWFGYDTVVGRVILNLTNFFNSAAPLVATLCLWREPLFTEGRIFQFVLGSKPRALPYAIVLFLFVLQLLTFHLFRMERTALSWQALLVAWGGQTLMGGGMEEGGWRGYLQPYFEQKFHITVSVLIVGVIWALWHLPYFFLPGNMHTGASFLMYMVTTTATAFTLTAIYKLTGSVLLCILFHGWQNGIVVNIPPNMSNPGFMMLWGIQTALSIVLCIWPVGTGNREIK